MRPGNGARSTTTTRNLRPCPSCPNAAEQAAALWHAQLDKDHTTVVIVVHIKGLPQLDKDSMASCWNEIRACPNCVSVHGLINSESHPPPEVVVQWTVGKQTEQSQPVHDFRRAGERWSGALSPTHRGMSPPATHLACRCAQA